MITVRPHAMEVAAEYAKPLQKCVWMASGVVTYRLCDLEFNCEVCPFDRAIRDSFSSLSWTGLRRPDATDDPRRR
jgi:hypothetical protein